MSRPPPFRFETLASRHQPTAPQIGFRNQRRSAVRRTDPPSCFPEDLRVRDQPA